MHLPFLSRTISPVTGSYLSTKHVSWAQYWKGPNAPQQSAEAELLQDDAHVPHRTAGALSLAKIKKRHVALGGTVELAYLWQVETCLEPFPNIRP